jgi:hypothetical protein
MVVRRGREAAFVQGQAYLAPSRKSRDVKAPGHLEVTIEKSRVRVFNAPKIISKEFIKHKTKNRASSERLAAGPDEKTGLLQSR